MPEHGNVCFRISCSWISCYQDVFTPSIGEKLVATREFDNTMDKQAVKVGAAYTRVFTVLCTFGVNVLLF